MCLHKKWLKGVLIPVRSNVIFVQLDGSRISVVEEDAGGQLDPGQMLAECTPIAHIYIGSLRLSNSLLDKTSSNGPLSKTMPAPTSPFPASFPSFPRDFDTLLLIF